MLPLGKLEKGHMGQNIKSLIKTKIHGQGHPLEGGKSWNQSLWLAEVRSLG
jgi:hypothetical protein